MKNELINTNYLRAKKAEAMQKRYDCFQEKKTLKVESYENAIVMPVKKIPTDNLQFGRGGVQVNQQFIELSGIPGRVYGMYPVESPEHSNETVAFLGYLVHHWGHFLVEGCARLWYALEAAEDVDKFVFVVNENEPESITGNYKELLELLGIWDKIEIINHPVRYRKVYIPECAYCRNLNYHHKNRDVFERIAKNAMVQADKCLPDRVFLSRGHFKKALIAEPGLDMLDNFFEKNGFAVIYPEQIGLQEMICYLRNANIVAAESGTVPHNFLFAQDGKECVIIERQTTVNEIQCNVDVMRSLQVTYIDGNYMVFPVSAGAGPFFLTYNHRLDQFAKDNDYAPPDPQYCSEKYRKICLRQYMRIYRKYYGYLWGFGDWQVQYANAYYEAYQDSLLDLKPYLSEERPFRISQYFNLRILKEIIKRRWIKHN